MKLARIELRGFKSFCDNTKISLGGKGISVILGPNGCGKSNVVDAIRWAMGEQRVKHLRGHDMSDVIFAGSGDRPAMGMASVLLYFDNTVGKSNFKYSDFSEICVGRRIYRDGNSEYLINNTPSRLKDVRELFLDTGVSEKGYSVIEQGTIGRIVTSKPEERRELIEEAAGTLLFKSRKKEAQKKLEEAKVNLSRVNDLLNELSDRHEKLGKQVARAEKFITAKSLVEKTGNELEAYRWNLLKEESTKISESINRKNEDEKMLVANLSNIETVLEAGAIKQLRLEKDIEMIRGEIDESRVQISEKESEYKVKESELKHMDEWSRRGQSDIKENEDALNAKQKLLEQARSESEQIRKQLSKADEEYRNKAENKNELKTVLVQMEETVGDTRNRLHQKMIAISEAQSKLSGLDDRLEQLKSQLSDKSGKNEESNEHNEKIIEVEKLQGRIKEIKSQDEEQKEQISDLKLDLHNLSDEIINLNKELESYNDGLYQIDTEISGINSFLEQPDTTDDDILRILNSFKSDSELRKRLGFLGSVSEVMSVKSIEMVAADKVWELYKDVLIFEYSSQLPKIKQFMMESEVASLRVFFADAPAKLIPQYIADRYQPVSNNFSSTNLPWNVDFFDKFRHVESADITDLPETLNSQGLYWLSDENVLLEPHNIFHLFNPDTVTPGQFRLEKKARLEKLDQERKEINEKKSRSGSLVNNKRALHEELQERYELANENRIRLESMLSENQRVLSIEERSLANLDKSLEKEREKEKETRSNIIRSNNQLNDMNLLLTQYIKDKHDLESSLAKSEEELIVYREQQESSDQDFFDLSGSLNQLRHQFETITKKISDLQSEEFELKNKAHSFQQKFQESTRNKKTVETAIGEIRAIIPVLIDQFETLEIERKELVKSLEEIRNEVKNNEKAKDQAFESITEMEKEKQNISVKRAEYDMEVSLIEERLKNESALSVKQVLQEMDVQGFDPDLTKKLMEEQKLVMKDLGNVNLEAFEEHRVLNERLTFLLEQKKDLTEGISSLEVAIEQIENDTKKQFLDTFNKINENLSRVFPLLFGGGFSEIVMTDKENILETGIDIVAHIPGKKLQYMTLLSGGEKALTAMALVFSIFLIKPSPFCILDEVDAPLDDVNVGRFCNVLKELNQTSQFIVITHNKVTMKAADYLIGVTMEEAGVSKIVTVKVDNYLE